MRPFVAKSIALPLHRENNTNIIINGLCQSRTKRRLRSRLCRAQLAVKTYVNIENAVVNSYKAIENGVVSGYKAVESATVEAYKSVEDTAIYMGKSLMEEYDKIKKR